MRIDSIIVNDEPAISSYLKKCLSSQFPEIAVRGEASNYSNACELIKTVNPDLVFSDVSIFNKNSVSMHDKARDYEIVYMSDRSEDAISAIRQDACGFMLQPLSISEIIASVGSAIRRLSERATRTSGGFPPQDQGFLPHTKMIGIPTMEGIDFIHMYEIVRCEGLQKCTRIVCTLKSNLISSYNIGEFRKLLEEHGFFSCHKSHLINLMHVRKFTREGFVFLSDNTAIPLARRKRLEFLHLIKHL